MTVPMKWKKSSRSAAEADCVELAMAEGNVGLARDSKNPAGPILTAAIPALIEAVKASKLDR